jgi:phosphoribosyl 1,2-cyclic phosphate phosphodiesterase
LRKEFHPTHQSVTDAIRFAERLNCPPTFLIHMSHSIGLHAQVDVDLPPYMHLAYDGLTLEI